MTDQERLEKLEQGIALIQEVEFSYPADHPTRRMIYKVMVDCFSVSQVGALITKLKMTVLGW